MRTFIAVEVPEEVRGGIGQYISMLKSIFDDVVKWVPEKNLHFTLKFLGEIKESELISVQECVSTTVSDFRSFTLEVSGIGFFPSENKPRVLWIGTDGGSDKLLEIYQYMETCLEQKGFHRDTKTFSSHLTIGRVRKEKKLILPERFPDFNLVTFDVRRLAVIKSTLTPAGPVYEKLFESEMKQKLE